MEKDGERTPILIVEIADEFEKTIAYERLISTWRFFQNYTERAPLPSPVLLLVPEDRPIPNP
jgi:hypothetical protein